MLAHTGPGKIPQHSFEPANFEELVRFADTIARSEMVTKDYQGKPANVVTAVMAGREIGLSAFQSLQSYAVINGRASLWGDAVLGLVRGSKPCKDVLEQITTLERFAHYSAEIDQADGDPRKISAARKRFWRPSLTPAELGDEHLAICEAVRESGEPVIRTFSVLDAKRAKLWSKNGPWEQYPQRMLQMRARSWALRDAFPDVLRGTVIAEEQMDVDPEPRAIRATVSAGTRTDEVRERLANLAGNEPQEGVVERPMPDFSAMLAQQIGEVLRAEAEIAGMDHGALEAFVRKTLNNKRLDRKNALTVVQAIRRWGQEKPPETDGHAFCTVCLINDPADDGMPDHPVEPLLCEQHGRPVEDCIREDATAGTDCLNRAVQAARAESAARLEAQA